MEPPDAEGDLVSRTSARLLAAGIDRRDRLTALHLLAVLDASTDVHGRVRRPLDDLAAEFELPVLSVLRSLDHLEHVGAIERDGGAVILLGRDSNGIGGLHLADFLDDVRAALHDDVPQVATRSPWLARSIAGLVAAAAAVGVITLAPSSPTTVQPIAAGTSTTSVHVAQEPSIELPVTSSTRAPRSTSSIADDAVATDSGVAAASACPSGTPTAELNGGVLRITNPTTLDLVVRAITVGNATLRTPIAVPAGQTVLRDIAAAITGSDARIEQWDWTDPTVERTCPS